MTSVHSTGVERTDCDELVATFVRAFGDDNYWAARLAAFKQREIGLHLAIFVEPYLTYLLEGRKTVESRFSMRRYPPYGRVSPGDVVLIKKSGGPIVGVCEVGDVWHYRLDPHSWKELRQTFTNALCAQDPAFWKAREAASFATLMRVVSVRAVDPITFAKKDRRGWVVLRSSPSPQDTA